MNAQQLLSWMKEPGNLGKEASAQLDTLTQTFPYFQTAHLLYIKSLHNENSFLYNNQLKVSAAYVTNRRVLYELITRKPAVKEVAAKEVAVAVEKEEVKIVETVKEQPIRMDKERTGQNDRDQGPDQENVRLPLHVIVNSTDLCRRPLFDFIVLHQQARHSIAESGKPGLKR